MVNIMPAKHHLRIIVIVNRLAFRTVQSYRAANMVVTLVHYLETDKRIIKDKIKTLQSLKSLQYKRSVCRQ